MNKRYLHHVWTRIRPLKVWYFLAAAAVFGLICVIALRQNYATMVSLRADVYAADESGKDVVGALNRLRSHVNGHMNTSLEMASGVYPPIQLKHTYDRLQQAEAVKAANGNGQVYTDAQRYCEHQFPNSVSGGPRVPCIEQYVKDHGGTQAAKIPDALYKFDFASPGWSPDLAGWSMVLAIACALLAGLRFGVGRLLQRVTR